MENFRNKSLKFDGINYDSWKEKMKTHLLCMGSGYWLIIKTRKIVIKEKKIENYNEEEREIFMCDMREREIILSTLLENIYNQVKTLITS